MESGGYRHGCATFSVLTSDIRYIFWVKGQQTKFLIFFKENESNLQHWTDRQEIIAENNLF